MHRICIAVVIMSALAGQAAAQSLGFSQPTRWAQGRAPSPIGQATFILFGRVDSGPTADLVMYDASTGQAYVALSNGSGFGPPRLFASGLPRISSSRDPMLAAMADVNGDGRDDLIVLNRGADNVPGAATAVVALSTGTTFSYSGSPVWNPSWCAGYQTCLFGDMNGDRRADRVAITQNFGTVFGSLSTGSRFGPNAIWNNFFCIRGEVCALGDVDGD